MIYFAQDKATNLIKIGFTGDIDARLRAIQTGCPGEIVLLLTTNGDQQAEKQLHNRFAACRDRGEWFRPAPDLIAFILQLSGTMLLARHSQEFDEEQSREPGPMRIYLAGPMPAREYQDDAREQPSERLDDWSGLASPDESLMFSDVGEVAWWRSHLKGKFPAFQFLFPEHALPDGKGHDEVGSRADEIVEADFNLIRNCDLVLAFIDSAERVGTLAEISFATGLGKLVVATVLSTVETDRIWFPLNTISRWLSYPQQEGRSGYCGHLKPDTYMLPRNEREAMYLMEQYLQSISKTDQ